MRKYKSSFDSTLRGVTYDVELRNLTEATASDVTLDMGPSPFVVDWPEAETYTPLLTCGCTLNFITSGVVTGLMADSYRQISVKLTDYTNNQIVFAGWLTPNIYSQAYDRNKEYLELTGIDEISALQYISYSQLIADRQTAADVKSFFTIIRLILLQYCPNISEIWLTNAVRGSSSGDCALLDLYANEQLFIDEELSCKEVIEYMLRYINATGFSQYGVFEVFDRDKTSGLTLKKYNVGSGNLVGTVNNTSFDVNNFDNYYGNTISTKQIYKDVSYIAKFGDFPEWQKSKSPNTYGTQDIVKLIAGTVNTHSEPTNWASIDWTVPNTFVTRAKLTSCPDNVKLFAYDSTFTSVTYPTFTDYFDVIDKGAYPNTSDASLYGNGDYRLLSSYVRMEDIRTADSYNNTGVSASDCIVLYTNNNTAGSNGWTTTERKRLAEITYNRNIMVTNKGYLDLTGTVQFENLYRRIPCTDHDATIQSYDKKTNNLLYIYIYVKIGNYFYSGSNANPKWSTNQYTPIRLYIDSNKGDQYFAEHQISKSFVDIDIGNEGFLIDLDGLPDIYGNITIGFLSYRGSGEGHNSDDYESDGKTKYGEITTIFIRDLDVKYINAPLATGDVEYYNSINSIYDNTFKDENLLSTFVDNSSIDTDNKACQHPPCDNIVLRNVSGHYVPNMGLFYSVTGNNYSNPIIPEKYNVDRLYNQYSSHTLKFELSHTNDYDMDANLQFKNSSSGYKYSILGASIDYYYNKTKFIIVQKK